MSGSLVVREQQLVALCEGGALELGGLDVRTVEPVRVGREEAAPRPQVDAVEQRKRGLDVDDARREAMPLLRALRVAPYLLPH
jgi:hypothetical protein